MHRNGFTLIEVLFSLTIALLIIINASLFVRLFKVNTSIQPIDNQRENNLYTLSSILKEGHDFTYGTSLEFNIEDKQYKVLMEGNRLVVKPGTNTILHDIEDINFENDHHNIYISFTQNDQKYRYFIGHDYKKE